MLLFHAAAGLYAVFMLVRHLPGARRGRAVAVLSCLAAAAVLVMAARGLLLALPPGR